LLPSVDVLIENNATGVLGRLGLGWDVLQEANPRLVLVSTQLYGDRGPWASRKGYGPSGRASGGLTWLWAHDVDAPRGVQCIHPDHFAGRLCAIGALAALRARALDGKGRHVDVAQFEAVIGLLADLYLAERLEPGAARPVGNRSIEHAPWNLYRCADDAGVESWLAVCVDGDEAWRSLVMVAAGAVPDEPAWRTVHGRLGDVARLDAALAAWLRDRDAAHVERALQDAGVAAGRAVHPRLVIDHPLYSGRSYVERIDQPGMGPVLLEGAAFTGTVMGRPRCAPAPLPGADTRDICRDLLGLEDAAIDDLVARGVLDA
jgi:crotonobetainyl-CoA:carnitine CoA-transferase CaiB-like acyl-CoA transferase